MSSEATDNNASPPEPTGKPSLWRLITTCLRVGATGFGGTMAMVALLHEYMVTKNRFVDDKKFQEAVAVVQVVPGPIAVNVMSYLGFTLRGPLGALVTVFSIILVPAVLVVALSPLYFGHQDSLWVKGAMRGIEGVVIAVVAVATWRLTTPAIKGWASAVIAAASFLVLALTKLSPVTVILAAGLVGLIALRPKPKPPVDEEGGADA
jgi:chromate transporter